MEVVPHVYGSRIWRTHGPHGRTQQDHFCFFCALCEQWLNGREQWDRHLKTSNHRNTRRWLRPEAIAAFSTQRPLLPGELRIEKMIKSPEEPIMMMQVSVVRRRFDDGKAEDDCCVYRRWLYLCTCLQTVEIPRLL